MLPNEFGRHKSKHRLFSVQIPEHKNFAPVPLLPSLNSHEIDLKKMRRMQAEHGGGDRRNERRPGEWRPLHPLLSILSILKLSYLHTPNCCWNHYECKSRDFEPHCMYLHKSQGPRKLLTYVPIIFNWSRCDTFTPTNPIDDGEFEGPWDGSYQIFVLKEDIASYFPPIHIAAQLRSF